MTNKKLDELVANNNIKSYVYKNIDENGNIDKRSQCRNTQQLDIVFNDGVILQIGTLCSGVLEDVYLTFEIKKI